MSNFFNERKRLEKVVKKAKEEMLQNRKRVDVNHNKENERALGYEYSVSKRRYEKILNITKNFIKKFKQDWKNNKVNKNRMRARLKGVKK